MPRNARKSGSAIKRDAEQMMSELHARRRAGETVRTSREGNGHRWLRAPRVLLGVLPIRRSQIPVEMLAGLTLAALGIPEVLGYAKIAGMPVVTGLYTILLPMAVFAVLGSSRHLVVGADSATAAILAAGLAGLAVAGSPQYVALAGLAALLAGAMLLLARLARLGFLANFLSRTVLVGFLTGVGIQVAIGQLPDMLGVPAGRGRHPAQLVGHAQRGPGRAARRPCWRRSRPSSSWVGLRRLAPRVPAALIAVVGAIVVSQGADLAALGVAGARRRPERPAAPGRSPRSAGTTSRACWACPRRCSSSSSRRARPPRAPTRLGTRSPSTRTSTLSVSARPTSPLPSPAPSSSTAARPRPSWSTARVGAASSPSSRRAAVVLLVLLLLTGPLAPLPIAVLAAVVFLIAFELIDVRGMRRILAVRRLEFAVALITAAAVVVAGRGAGHRPRGRRVDRRPPAAQLRPAQQRPGEVCGRPLAVAAGPAGRAPSPASSSTASAAASTSPTLLPSSTT